MKTSFKLLASVTIPLLVAFSSAFAKSQPAKSTSSDQNPKAVIQTTEGAITVELFKSKAPVTVANFIDLAKGNKDWVFPDVRGNDASVDAATRAKGGKVMKKTPLYNGTIFHRVIPEFMIQGGDPLGNGTGGPRGKGFPFEDEVSDSDSFDQPGILAMANSGANTNGSQFFITLKPTPWLNGKHTIFGKVTKGMEVVEKIVETPKNEENRPLKPIKITEIDFPKS